MILSRSSITKVQFKEKDRMSNILFVKMQNFDRREFNIKKTLF